MKFLEVTYVTGTVNMFAYAEEISIGKDLIHFTSTKGIETNIVVSNVTLYRKLSSSINIPDDLLVDSLDGLDFIKDKKDIIPYLGEPYYSDDVRTIFESIIY